MWHGYFGIENLALNQVQKGLLVEELKELGEKGSPYPQFNNHWRIRLDNEAVIFESLWQDDQLTPTRIKQYLGSIFGVDPASIDHRISTVGVNVVAIFSRLGVDYLRMAIFGGVSCTWQESRLAVLAYLKANSEAWESIE